MPFFFRPLRMATEDKAGFTLVSWPLSPPSAGARRTQLHDPQLRLGPGVGLGVIPATAAAEYLQETSSP